MENYNSFFSTVYRKTLWVELLITHLSLASFLWDIANSADPENMQHSVTSDQGLHCLLLESSIKI